MNGRTRALSGGRTRSLRERSRRRGTEWRELAELFLLGANVLVWSELLRVVTSHA